MISSLVGPRDSTRYASSEAILADFATRPESPDFAHAPRPEEPFAAFGRSSVLIRRDGGEAFLADRNTVTLYGPGALYRRAPVSPSGDRSSWFALRRRHGLFDDPATDRRVSVRLCPLPAYMELLRVVARARAGLADGVEEALRGVLDGVGRGRSPLGEGDPGQAVVRVEAARRRIAGSFREPVPLRDLFSPLGEPHYEICRAFGRVLGWTPHRYREELRLRAALEEIPAAAGSLTDLALSLGYSSHSHFTERFRRATGLAPSEWARRITPVV